MHMTIVLKQETEMVEWNFESPMIFPHFLECALLVTTVQLQVQFPHFAATISIRCFLR